MFSQCFVLRSDVVVLGAIESQSRDDKHVEDEVDD